GCYFALHWAFSWFISGVSTQNGPENRTCRRFVQQTTRDHHPFRRLRPLSGYAERRAHYRPTRNTLRGPGAATGRCADPGHSLRNTSGKHLPSYPSRWNESVVKCRFKITVSRKIPRDSSCRIAGRSVFRGHPPGRPTFYRPHPRTTAVSPGN